LKKYFVIAEEKFLCTSEGELVLFTEQELTSFSVDVLNTYSLGRSKGFGHESEFFVLDVQVRLISSFQWLGLRQFLELLPEEEFQLAGRALQIVRWSLDHQFCGRCGRPTQSHASDLAKSCGSCKLDFYPRLSPCIITLITRGDECLLAWHARSKEEKFSCVAGFIEVGESPEQTLIREVREEVGLEVANIRYVASQPWPFPGQLMLGYFADYASGDICLDEKEIVAAKWYKYNQLPKVPPITTISGQLINAFVQQRMANHQN
jgi:NAD+ diphosphatase